MIRLAASYLLVSVLAPISALLAFSGGDLFVTALMALPLVVATFAFLWLVLEVARRKDLLTRSRFLKCSLVCGVSALLLVSLATKLLVQFAPSINLGAALGDFSLLYFVAVMFAPVVLYTGLTGVGFWYTGVKGNSYVRAAVKPARGTLVSLPSSAPSPAPETEEKRAA